jgi:transposase
LWLEARFGKPFHPSSLSRVLGRLDLSRQKTRPVHPEVDVAAQERFRKDPMGHGSAEHA